MMIIIIIKTTPNLPTDILDFGGSASGRVSIVGGWSSDVRRESPGNVA